MKPLFVKLFFVTCSTLLFTTFAHAELNEKLDQLCGKIKTCALDQAGGADQPPEILAMMDQMFDGMCKSMLDPYYKTIGQAGLEDKAEVCLDTILETSCDTMMSNQGEYTTPECDEFKAAADEAGVDLGQ